MSRRWASAPNVPGKISTRDANTSARKTDVNIRRQNSSLAGGSMIRSFRVIVAGAILAAAVAGAASAQQKPAPSAAAIQMAKEIIALKGASATFDPLIPGVIEYHRNIMRAAARSEQAFRQELAVFVLAVPLAFLVGSGLWQRIALIGVVALILIVELLNTAIEKLSDHVTPDTHPVIGWVKDMGSAAVGLSLLLAGLVWLAALGERLGVLE